MGVRQALNTVYAHAVRNMDDKDRKDFDSQLYGWSEMNRKGTQALFQGDMGGGEG